MNTRPSPRALARPLPIIAVTTGEPAGIGPDVSLLAAAHFAAEPAPRARIVLVGDGQLLAARARQIGVEGVVVEYDGTSEPSPGTIEVAHMPTEVAVVPGTLEARNAAYVLATLDWAIDAAVADEIDAVVTAPVQKSIISESGVAFSGHTEYFAARTNTPRVVMMLAGAGMRVALVTTHLPISEVARAITRDAVLETVRILEAELRLCFGVQSPRILVCGLNPHAGENGYLGREEVDIIAPVLEQLRAEGMDVQGPLPADTLFQPKYLEHCDAVLAMYHDQGLPVLKFASFGEGVNITLGLPIIRTSVDHGTALDLAATGGAEAQSMIVAVNTALELVTNRRTS